MISKVIKSCLSQVQRLSLHSSCRRLLHKSSSKHNTTSRADFRMSPNVFRQKQLYTATVQDVFDASSTIKILRLYVQQPGFSFKAGQWVDFYVPGIEEVTGYSMTSAPNEAKEKGILELSVKYGSFPPTHWVHKSCGPGAEVQIRVGGDFFYDPLSIKSEAEANLLLIGGGVGINPLVSILCEYRDLLLSTRMEDTSDVYPGRVHLLYSAKTEEELVFRDTFSLLQQEHPKLTCQYFVTCKPEHGSLGINYGRIQEKDIADSLTELKSERTLCYICGPSTMTDDLASTVLKLGIKKEHIRFEKWW